MTAPTTRAEPPPAVVDRPAQGELQGERTPPLRHGTREQRRRRRRVHRLLVDSVRDYAIFALDPEGYVSAGTRRPSLKGYTPEQIIGRHSRCSTSRHHARRQARAQARGRRARRALEERVRVRSDGSLFWANVSSSRCATSRHAGGLAKVTRDLTERRRPRSAAPERGAVPPARPERHATTHLHARPRGRVPAGTPARTSIKGTTPRSHRPPLSTFYTAVDLATASRSASWRSPRARAVRGGGLRCGRTARSSGRA